MAFASVRNNSNSYCQRLQQKGEGGLDILCGAWTKPPVYEKVWGSERPHEADNEKDEGRRRKRGRRNRRNSSSGRRTPPCGMSVGLSKSGTRQPQLRDTVI